MPYTLDDLGKALAGQLFDVCGGRSLPGATDSFLTWCQPGVPFLAEQFGFASGELDLGNIDDAATFARLVDFVPDAGTTYDHERQQAALRPDGPSRLSTVYEEVLRGARVVSSGLSDEEQRKIIRLGGLLRSTRTVRDVGTGEPRRITEVGPMLRAYNERLAAYVAAVVRCNGTQVADSLGRRCDCVANADQCRRAVQSGLDAWIAIGYRDEVDQIHAYLDQVSGRDLVLWRRALLDMLDGAALTAGDPGLRFRHTSPVPAGFISGDGWTRHHFRHDALDFGTQLGGRSWRAGATPDFGLAGSADGTPSQHIEVGFFELSLELCPVLISRPWFYPPLLRSRGWTWNEQLCDGGDPPAGRLPGYPATVLFVRNLRIESAEFARLYTQLVKAAGDRASARWGPFWLGGRHQMGSRELLLHAETDESSVSVPGVQIIAFVNHQLGKAPDPLPELDEGRFR
jgi:hypothetical protein